MFSCSGTTVIRRRAASFWKAARSRNNSEEARGFQSALLTGNFNRWALTNRRFREILCSAEFFADFDEERRMTDWLDHFTRNHRECPPMPWDRDIVVSERLRRPLIRSLQRFQVGESGEGRHLKRGAAATGDERYVRTIALFVGEEQEHSRWLARLILKMGGSLLTHHWSDVVFILLRRYCGLRVELLILLVAEMIAIRYYRALDEGVNDPTLNAVFAQIRRDEDSHVAFHVEFLNNAFARQNALYCFLVRTLWFVVYRLACLVVMWDHRGILSATGVRPGAFWRDTGAIFTRTADAIFRPTTAPRAVPAPETHA
jgi:hypothetical protein